MKTATTHYAKTHLSELIREVREGETVVILNGRVPVAKLTAVDTVPRRRPKAGMVTSAPVEVTDDAFEPLSEDQLEEWGI